MTDELTRIGFIPVSPGNTDTTPATTLRYAPGRAAQARLVARYLVGPVTFEESDQVVGMDVVLVTGTDFQGTLTEPKADDQVPPASSIDHHDVDHRAGHDDHHHDARGGAPRAVAGGGRLLRSLGRDGPAAPARPRACGHGSWRR